MLSEDQTLGDWLSAVGRRQVLGKLPDVSFELAHD